jgi:hypothetical protein
LYLGFFKCNKSYWLPFSKCAASRFSFVLAHCTNMCHPTNTNDGDFCQFIILNFKRLQSPLRFLLDNSKPNVRRKLNYAFS